MIRFASRLPKYRSSQNSPKECHSRKNSADNCSLSMSLLQRNNIIYVVLQKKHINCQCEQYAVTALLSEKYNDCSDESKRINLPWDVVDGKLVTAAIEVSAENTHCTTKSLSLTTFDVNVWWTLNVRVIIFLSVESCVLQTMATKLNRCHKSHTSRLAPVPDYQIIACHIESQQKSPLGWILA
jgi:hypothetical protein